MGQRCRICDWDVKRRVAIPLAPWVHVQAVASVSASDRAYASEGCEGSVGRAEIDQRIVCNTQNVDLATN